MGVACPFDTGVSLAFPQLNIYIYIHTYYNHGMPWDVCLGYGAPISYSNIYRILVIVTVLELHPGPQVCRASVLQSSIRVFSP